MRERDERERYKAWNGVATQNLNKTILTKLTMVTYYLTNFFTQYNNNNNK